MVPAAGLPLELIPPVPMPRRPGPGPGCWSGRGCCARCSATVADPAPGRGRRACSGFGGYVSTPAYLAARRLGLPIVIHEQNALPGLANRLAARLTRHVYTSFPQTPLPHATCIGLPLRRGITELDRAAAGDAARTGFGLLPRPADSAGQRWLAGRAEHQPRGARGPRPAAGRRDLGAARARRPKNMTAETVRVRSTPTTGAVYAPVAYVEQMEQAYAAADLMLGRCGASTVLETAAVGLPAVFVPYPHGNGEQARNAELVVKAGGGTAAGRRRLHAGVGGDRDPGAAARRGAAAGNGGRPGRRCPDRRGDRAGARRCWR